MRLKFILLLILSFSFSSIQAQNNSENPVCKKRKLEVWEKSADEGKYQKAIVELLNHIESNKKNHKHRDYWHLGQLYAFDNEYQKALKYFRKSTNIFDKIFDREWKLYYQGTIAFLKRDKNKLKKISNKLINKHSAYYERNATTLINLYNNFDKSYLEAYSKN